MSKKRSREERKQQNERDQRRRRLDAAAEPGALAKEPRTDKRQPAGQGGEEAQPATHPAARRDRTPSVVSAKTASARDQTPKPPRSAAKHAAPRIHEAADVAKKGAPKRRSFGGVLLLFSGLAAAAAGLVYLQYRSPTADKLTVESKASAETPAPVAPKPSAPAAAVEKASAPIAVPPVAATSQATTAEPSSTIEATASAPAEVAPPPTSAISAAPEPPAAPPKAKPAAPAPTAAPRPAASAAPAPAPRPAAPVDDPYN